VAGVETPLPGGTSNRGRVVRVGNTVRRPQSAGSPAVHELLRHLEQVGFAGAPRYLGQDELGREVVSYLPGEVPIEPYPAWALTEDALASVGRLLANYHEAVRGFDGSGRVWSATVPAPFRGGLVSHNDPNLDNVVFRDGAAVALLDFDLAGPGSLTWDLALAARLWVPLRAPGDVDPHRRGRTAPRLRTLLDAYGVTGPQRRQVVQAALHTHDWSYGIVQAGARSGEPGYVEYWTAGAQQRSRRGRTWLARNVDLLAAAV